MKKEIKWAFFGSSEFSVNVLDNLEKDGYLPSLVITIPDKPKGRKLIITSEEVKIWAEARNIECIQPASLKTDSSQKIISDFFPNGVDLFVVTNYGKMIPDSILNIPKHKTLNIHPSLLPKLRGASPIKSAILKENETGVTIIRLDSEMDHGPIITQQILETKEWPPYESELSEELAMLGAKLLSKIMSDWVDEKIIETEQDHSNATFCSKINKEDAEINLHDDANKNLRKIRAYEVWPAAYFFDNEKRIKIKKAKIENDKLIIEKVIPEGKKEMSYEDYLRGKRF